MSYEDFLAMVKENRWYVGHSSALKRDWGWPTEQLAIEHAQKLANENDEQAFVVKIVGVVWPTEELRVLKLED